jgi:hypothetical protein
MKLARSDERQQSAVLRSSRDSIEFRSHVDHEALGYPPPVRPSRSVGVHRHISNPCDHSPSPRLGTLLCRGRRRAPDVKGLVSVAVRNCCSLPCASPSRSVTRIDGDSMNPLRHGGADLWRVRQSNAGWAARSLSPGDSGTSTPRGGSRDGGQAKQSWKPVLHVRAGQQTLPGPDGRLSHAHWYVGLW